MCVFQAYDVMVWLNERKAVALVHPHTAHGKKDHSSNALWVGKDLGCELGIFDMYPALETRP